MINKARLIKLTQKLIQIDSQNPPGDESKIAYFIYEYFKKLKLKPKIYEFYPKRANVLVKIEGTGSKEVLVSPHLDTVPAGKGWKIPPFLGKIKDGKIYGLGATDCKGNLGVSLEVITSLVEDKVKLSYTLVFAGTADEETGSQKGLVPLLKRRILKPDFALILDAEDFNLIICQKGLIHLKVKLKGKRAHGAYPWRGKNAIQDAVDILKEIKQIKFSYPENPLLRPPTINMGTIHGGDKVNIVADWCEFELDIRYLPGMDKEDILRRLKAIIKKYTPRFKLELEGTQPPYFISKEGEIFVEKIKNIAKEINIPLKITGSEGATVLSFFKDKNIPAIALGFGAKGKSHTKDEFVKIEDLYKGAIFLEKILKSLKL